VGEKDYTRVEEENEQETICKNLTWGDILIDSHLPQHGILECMYPSPNGYAHPQLRRNQDPLYRRGRDDPCTRWRVPHG
jgi:hypothetical protein